MHIYLEYLYTVLFTTHANTYIHIILHYDRRIDFYFEKGCCSSNLVIIIPGDVWCSLNADLHTPNLLHANEYYYNNGLSSNGDMYGNSSYSPPYIEAKSPHSIYSIASIIGDGVYVQPTYPNNDSKKGA